MAKSSTSSFVLTLPIHTEVWQQHILDKRLNIARQLYNDCLNEGLKRIKRMRKSQEYRHWIKQTKSKDRTKALQDLLCDYGVSEFDFITYINIPRKIFKNQQKLLVNGKTSKEHIDAKASQFIVKRVWSSLQKYLFEGKKSHFKRYGEVSSVESNVIKYKDGFIHWSGIECKLMVRKKDVYAQQALENKIKYVRLVRKEIKGKVKYYAQMTIEGIAPAKLDKQGQIKYWLGKGEVGIDIGTSTVAVVGEDEVVFTELASGIDKIERQKTLISRKMDRSRRATNKDNFNEDGTVKKGSKKWVKSKRYVKLKAQLNELQRKVAEQRKLAHRRLANQVAFMGNSFSVEEMSFKGLQKRSSKTEISEKTGKFKKKKRFGKTIANKAPAMFISWLKYKVVKLGGTFTKVNTWDVKASQYNHVKDEYVKKQLGERWSKLDEGLKVQRDLYSAFLIQNVDNGLSKVDRNKCMARFQQFKNLHDKEMERVKDLNYSPTSMGA